ncbi:MAG: hypothetical protein IPN90_12245 [Elusimicrobia bacterium]|nr:hypothetical protein [Elusimicrobiota bacterium]
MSGITLAEILITVAIGGALMIIASKFISGSMVGAVRTGLTLDGVEAVNIALFRMERDMEEMTLISMAQPNQLIFQLSSSRLPGYNPNGDMDGDGITNEFDPDDDGDGIITSTIFNGLDLVDQDEDMPLSIGFRKIDVQCRYMVDNEKRLVRQLNFQESGWSAPEILMTKVAADPFTYMGSINHMPGPEADTTPADGIVTWNEIDGHPVMGNSNGTLDLGSELIFISAIKVRLARDGNSDGKIEFEATTSISPPLLKHNRDI